MNIKHVVTGISAAFALVAVFAPRAHALPLYDSYEQAMSDCAQRSAGAYGVCVPLMDWLHDYPKDKRATKARSTLMQFWAEKNEGLLADVRKRCIDNPGNCNQEVEWFVEARNSPLEAPKTTKSTKASLIARARAFAQPSSRVPTPVDAPIPAAARGAAPAEAVALAPMRHLSDGNEVGCKNYLKILMNSPTRIKEAPAIHARWVESVVVARQGVTYQVCRGNGWEDLECLRRAGVDMVEPDTAEAARNLRDVVKEWWDKDCSVNGQ